jgi:hypothetical protein
MFHAITEALHSFKKVREESLWTGIKVIVIQKMKDALDSPEPFLNLKKTRDNTYIF